MIAIVQAAALPEDGAVRARSLQRFFKDIPLLWLAVIGLVYIGLIVVFRDFTPFYDGGLYYAGIERLVTQPFRWEHLHLEGHVSPIYTVIVSASQFFAQGNMIPIFATNFALGLFATCMLYLLLRHVLGAVTTNDELMMTASIFAITPVFLVHGFHINLDFPLAVFLIPYLYFLLTKKLWLSGLFALALLMTKETGIMVYVVTLALYLLMYVVRPSGAVRRAFLNLLEQWPLLVPGVIFLVYYAGFRTFAGGGVPYWGHGTVESNPLFMLLDFNLADMTLRSFLGNIFILNFHWLMTLVIVVALLHYAVRWMTGQRTSPIEGIRFGDFLFFTLLLLGLVYITTRVRPWNNPRYVLVAFPLLIIVFQYALVSLVKRSSVRMGILGIVLTLIALANVVTVDPVSKKFYGTIMFGEHPWLDMTTMIGPYGSRRDQQAYNLELLELHTATHHALMALRPAPNSVMLAGPYANFYLAIRYRNEDFTPTLRLADASPLRWYDTIEHMKPDQLPAILGEQREFTYFAFPNFINDTYLAELHSHYPLLREDTFGRSGYLVRTYTFGLPEAAPIAEETL